MGFWNMVGLMCLGVYMYEKMFVLKTRGVSRFGEPVNLILQAGSLIAFSSAFILESNPWFIAGVVLLSVAAAVIGSGFKSVINVKNCSRGEVVDAVEAIKDKDILPFDKKEEKVDGKQVIYSHSESKAKLEIKWSTSFLNDNRPDNARLTFTKDESAYSYQRAEEELFLRLRSERENRTFYRQNAACMLLVIGFSMFAYFITGIGN
ncbi:hypothetical protein [Alteribacter natronophilus]|uniref:hypothetical protein n=1 Tax=Alteribacter natronophilus TaxID=2583810 RepID=UPI00110D800C|nr:hypothetical protein [Alteribacter natronophilus]TMW73007.1 hypothetical protein FGB90_01480 [Alteribacter natronophilus]